MKRIAIPLLVLLSIIWSGNSGSNELPGSVMVYLLGMPVSSQEFKLSAGIINGDLINFQQHYLQSSLEFYETYPSSLVLDREKNRLYVTFYARGIVGVYDAVTFNLVKTFEVPDAVDIAKIAVSSEDGQSRVYVLEKDTSHVYVFDRDSLEPIPEEEFDLVSPARSIWAAYECLFAADAEGIRCYKDKVPIAIFPVLETINYLQGDTCLYPDVILYALAEVTPKVLQNIAGCWQIETLEFSGTIRISQEGDIAGGDEWTWQDGHKETVLGGGFLSGPDGSVFLDVVTTGGEFGFVGVMRYRADFVTFLNYSGEEENSWSLGFLIKKGQSYSEGEFSGTWNVKGLHVSGNLHSDGAGGITGGSFTWQDGTEETISSGTYTIDTQTGSMILTLSTNLGLREFTGSFSSGRDVAILTNEVTAPTLQKDASAKDIILLVRTINANYETRYLAGTWSVKAMHFWGSLTIDAAGQITGGNLITPEGEMEVTGGSFSFSQGTVVTRGVAGGKQEQVTFRVEGVISPYRDIIVFVDPTTSPYLSDRNLGVLTRINSSEIITPRKGDEIVTGDQHDILLKIDLSSETRTETTLEAKGLGLAVTGCRQRVFALCGLPADGEQMLYVFDGDTLQQLKRVTIPAEYGPSIDCAVTDYYPRVQLKKVCTSHPEGVATVGQEVTFSVTIINTSTIPVASIPLSDLFHPSCLSFLRATVQPDEQKEGQLNWEDITGQDNLAPGDSVSVEITFLAIQSANPVVNTVVARDVKDIFGNTLSETQSTCNLIIESQGTITVVKTRLSPPGSNIQFGEEVVFQITITNNSPFAIKTLPFRDTYNPEFLDFVSSSLPLNVISPGQLQSDNLLGENTLAPGDGLVLTITFQARKEVAFTVNSAQVDEAKDVYDHVVSGDISEVAVSILPFHVNVAGGVTTASYVMVSFPFTPDDADFLATVADDLGAYDPTRWRLFRWNPDANPPGYEEYSPDNDFFDIEPGKAYWVLSRFPITIDGTGTPSSIKQNFILSLRPGWNQIGCPFNFPVAWSNVVASTGENSYPASEGHTLWKYSNGEYLPATHLEPGTGYWVWNPDPLEVLHLSIPPLKENRKTSTRKVSVAKAEPQPPAPPGQALVPSGDSGGGCFIATACFGSPMASQVQILRKFRDQFLMPHWLGKRFVSFYYRHSPAAAGFLRAHPFFRKTVRMMLVPVVRICQVLLKTKS